MTKTTADEEIRSRARSRASARLGALRVRLTLFYGIASAVGLMVLALIITISDSQLRNDRITSDLRLRAVTASRLVFFENREVRAQAIVDDPELYEGIPQIYIFAPYEGMPPALLLPPPFIEFNVPSAQLALLAEAALETSEEAIDSMTSADGVEVRALALPKFDEGGAPPAGVVTVRETATEKADHRRLVLIVWSGAVGLALLLSIAGWILAGRSIRPAAAALDQQERFLADAAHELRTPVATIRALGENALAGGDDNRDALDRIVGVAGGTGTLVDDLLILARMDTGDQPVRHERVRLDQLVEEVATGYENLQVSSEPSIVLGDPTLLRRAIVNLCTNAVRHGRADNPAAAIWVSVGHGTVIVADSGPGIEPGLEENLFARFHSGRRSSGSGLGLAIVNWIAGVHGGTIVGQNRREGGTVFTLTLPETS